NAPARGSYRASISAPRCRNGRLDSNSTLFCADAARRRSRSLTMSSGITPSQTIGPFFAYALTPEFYGFVPLAGNMMRTPDVEGIPISIEGRVFDGRGAIIDDAMVELWQADGAGRYARNLPAGSNRRFTGFGRCETKPGGFSFETVKPGP